MKPGMTFSKTQERMDPTLEAAAEVKLKSFLIYGKKKKKNTLVRVRLKRILIFKGKIKNNQ